jgi:hypothetical protein
MENELNQFLAEGMKKYKEASRLMVLFGKNIKNELHDILSERKKWGIFKAIDNKKPRSTKYWDEYPCLNAEIQGRINNKDYFIRIDVNWFMSEDDYPFYSISIPYGEPDEFIVNKFNSYESTIYENIDNKGLKFFPDPNNFNLKRDFNLLIDEFLMVISKE